MASSVLGIVGSAVVVLATAVFLAISPQAYLTGGLKLLPASWRPRGRQVAQEIARTLQLWFVGQLLDMTIVAILVGVGLVLLVLRGVLADNDVQDRRDQSHVARIA